MSTSHPSQFACLEHASLPYMGGGMDENKHEMKRKIRAAAKLT
jgi:hypothetical protein